jgi:precorrin-6A/cobalt-precorrin-6A reductase
MDSHRCNPAGLERTSSASDMRKRILILGGTTEAREFAQALAARGDWEATMSLAGRTAAPLPQSVPVRRGGFGGITGLVEYMREQQIGILVDATHPYAATISAHALTAASQTNTPMITLSRPPWEAVAGDQWMEVQSVQEAVNAIGLEPRHTFLTLGRQELDHFAAAPQHHYWIRSVDPVERVLAVPHAEYILARGPFEEERERALLLAHAIDVVVAKNSGGLATYGKIAAARLLGIPVILVRRPPESAAPRVATVGEAIEWLDHVLIPADRGV